MKLMVTSFGDTGSRRRPGARALLEVLVTVALLASVPGIVLAASGFTARASVSPVVQYLNDTVGTTFTLTIDNQGDVPIGAVEITRPATSWTITACPAAPLGWSTQRADTKCRYRSASTATDDIAGHALNSAFQLTATTAPGTQNVTGTWTVVVSKTNGFDDKSKLKTAAPESPGLAITAYTFQILDAVVVPSAPVPGSACPVVTPPANHSTGTGATGQTIAICGKNRATLALTPTAAQASLAGTFISSPGTFASGSIAANSASSVVLGSWSNVTITGTSGPNKTIVTKVGSASNRTSPLTTLASTCPPPSTAGETCVANGGYTAIDDAPTVSSTSPINGATQVAVNTNIVVNFSESVNATTSSFALECPTGTPKTFVVSGSGTSSITLDPTADLPEGTTCSVKVVASQIHDTDLQDPPDTMTADYNFSFTTDSAPAVTTTTPANGATGVSTSGNITINFSEPVTATASSFTLECPSGTGKAFTVSGSGTSTITLDPTADLPATTVCTATVLAAGISDVDTGDPPDNLAANYVFSFTTVDAAPTVMSTAPANSADHVAVNTNIVVNFSEPVTATTSSFTLECPTSTAKTFAVSGSGTSSITLDPTADLPEGTVCAVKVIANQISDVDAVDPPDNMAADYSFSFTTDSAPAVTTTTPADNATDVDPSANITVNFNEPVTVSSTSLQLDSSFDILCGNFTHFAFTLAGSGTSTITLDPTLDLPSTATCTVTAIAANISDSDAGDPPDHPVSDTSFSFTTQDAAPSVTSTNPADGATNVSSGANIVINFSESVTASGSSFILECPSGTAQAFTVGGSPSSTITLDPTANLPLAETCTVTVIADQISDTDAIDPPDNMAANYVFSFTTAADQAPTDISLSNSSVNENQPSGTTVGTFSTTDADPGDTFTYSLVSGTGSTDNSSFQIVGDTLKTNAIFDFETKSSYSIRVRSTDSGSLTFDKQFTISITNVNEPPTDISLSNSSIDENKPSGSLVGNLSQVGDPDSGETYTFTLLTSGCSGSFPDSSSFQISGSQLQSAVSFDFETKNSYTICVRVNDPGSPNLSFEKQFTITINDVNDPPVATADSYSGAVGNTRATLQISSPPSGPNVALTGNVLTNNDTDEDVPAQPLTAVAETVASTGGGSATINTDGSFTFLPGVGDKNQDDTFTYHVTDGTATSAGTVTVHIDDFLVWYVDSASAAATHDGRSISPFLNLSSLNAAGGSGDSDGTGDYIFLYQGSGSYGGGIPLEANQKLLGEKNGLTVNSISLVPAGSTAPVITNASGSGVGLASGVDVQGLDISGTSGDAINGSAVTTATVGTTTAVNISSAGGDGVDLSGAASGNISIASPITGSVGHSVSVAGRSGGITSFSGAISDAGTGILLTGNTGATINLTGGVTASTGTSNAFVATGGGTVNVTGATNTLATTTGTPLDVENTTIGSSNLNFQSVSANGAARGIALIGTGSTGHLTVTGTGSAGTGGTLASIAGADVATNNCGDLGSSAPAGVGVYLKNTTSPSLSYMSFTGTFGNFGILGYSVNGFTLDNTTMTGTFGDNVNQDEDTVHFCTLTGNASITNDTISNGAETNLRVVNASGTLNRLTLQNSTIGLNQANGGGGTLFEADGGTFNATVEDTTFQGSRGSPFEAVPQAGATMDLDFGSPGHGNTVHNTHGNIVAFAQDLIVAAGGTLTFDVNSNHFDSAAAVQAQGGVLINAANSTAVASGYFRNNTIGTSGALNSGSSGNDPALDVESNGGGDLTIVVSNNQMYQWGSNGAGFLLQAGANGANPVTFNATVTGNTIAQPGTYSVANNSQGFQLNNGTNSGENFTTCLRFASNVVNGSGTGTGGDARFRQRFDTRVTLPGYTGASTGGTLFADMVAYIAGLNTPAPIVTGVSSTAAGGGFFNTPGGAACATPAF